MFILEHQPLPVIAIDTKIDENLPCLADSAIIEGLDNFSAKMIKQAQKQGIRSFIIRPTPEETADPVVLDEFLYSLHDGCRRVCIYWDELYTLHNQGRAGKGLTAILTRGRSRKQTFIGGSQRPAWISIFCLSEADYFMIYDLNMPEDRKRIQGVTAIPEETLTGVDNHSFLWFDVANANHSHFDSVPLPARYDQRQSLGAKRYRWV